MKSHEVVGFHEFFCVGREKNEVPAAETERGVSPLSGCSVIHSLGMIEFCRRFDFCGRRYRSLWAISAQLLKDRPCLRWQSLPPELCLFQSAPASFSETSHEQASPVIFCLPFPLFHSLHPLTSLSLLRFWFMTSVYIHYFPSFFSKIYVFV